jgi:hypothetical protein
MTLTTDAIGFCRWCRCKAGPDETTCECNCHGPGGPALRLEIETLLIAYDGGGHPDPHIDDWVRLIDREKRKVVDSALALAYARHFRGGPEFGPEEFMQPILDRLFPRNHD